MNNRVGKLLIAHPNLPKDNWFNKTVIYIYADDDEKGTLGVAMNVKTNLPVKKVCYEKGVLYPDSTKAVFKGGPVAEASIFMFHSDDWKNNTTLTAGPRYCLTSDDTMFEKLALGDTPAYWRLFLGICAWQPGQLDMELSGRFPFKSEHSWLTADANDHILFEYDGEEQWQKALELSSQQMINSYF
jgi:putative transcriptional regulator